MPDSPEPIPTLTPQAAQQAQALQLEQARAAADAFSRLNGALELQAAVLALMLPPGSKRAVRAWQIECETTPNAAALREHASHLVGAARLPWFETLLSRLRGQPLAARQALLAATRRVMGARGVVRPIDKLHWLAMRQRLGETSAADRQSAAAADLSRLPQSDVSAIAIYSAFLSRLVPAEATAGADAPDNAPGLAWYASVMEPWGQRAAIPPCEPPDTDGLVHALQELQALPWMQRPTLVRSWVVSAQQHSRHGRLGDGAADALRMTCSLLDSPLPPELARHYGDHPLETAR